MRWDLTSVIGVTLKDPLTTYIEEGVLTRHRMMVLEDCDILEVSTPKLEDVVRLEDRYGRADRKSD